MNKTIMMDFEVDRKARQINVTREFNAPRELVWQAWTDAEILDQWWAPKPWKAVTRSMDFKEGGYWLYFMQGPEGERHWSRFDYLSIKPGAAFSGQDAFCDEQGKVNTALPRMVWENAFNDEGESTLVKVKIKFEKEEDLKAIVDMGFKEGFSAGLENLDHWLSAHFKLRAENKTSAAFRVTSYLNFNGNTEEAMKFYREVFKGKFAGKGLQRFKDIKMPEGAPAMSEADKNLIIHAELHLPGGHVIMATDAPESMGFTLESGTNMHINVEPASREETERIFKALADGGQVIMPLQDMFFGAYFGQLRDRYGINWMLTYQEAGK